MPIINIPIVLNVAESIVPATKAHTPKPENAKIIAIVEDAILLHPSIIETDLKLRSRISIAL